MSSILICSLRHKRVLRKFHRTTFWDARECLSSMKGNTPLKTKGSALQKLALWMQPFVQGTKGLYQENLQAWHIRNRIKQTQAANKNSQSEIPQTNVSRREMMIVRQAHRDLFKSLPLMVLFAVPLVGYAAPILGYKFPKQLLPWQFWSDDQKTRFFQEDALTRTEYHPKLKQILRPIMSISDGPEKHKNMLLVNDKSLNISPLEMHKIAPFFEESGPLCLKKLNDDHLSLLAQIHASNPGLAFIYTFLPKSYLVRYLRRRAEELRVDDLMLIKEGTEDLSLSELEFACSDRGIVAGYGKVQELRGALNQWLSMYSKDSKNEVMRYATSLICHAPALVEIEGPSGSQN